MRINELNKTLYNDCKKILEIDQSDIPYGIIVSVPKYTDFGPWSVSYVVPYLYHFQDLDNDGIPEAFIAYGIFHGEISQDQVYKFNGSSYELIGLSNNRFYIDQQNRIVAVGPGIFHYIENCETFSAGNGIQLFELSGSTMIYNEFVDSEGGKEYKGVKYSEIGWMHHRDFYENDTGFEMLIDYLNLKPLPLFDCSDIVKSIKNTK